MADERNTLVGILSMPQAPSSAFQENVSFQRHRSRLSQQTADIPPFLK